MTPVYYSDPEWIRIVKSIQRTRPDATLVTLDKITPKSRKLSQQYTEMFYTLSSPNDVEDIIQHGFSTKYMTINSHGKGIELTQQICPKNEKRMYYALIVEVPENNDQLYICPNKEDINLKYFITLILSPLHQ